MPKCQAKVKYTSVEPCLSVLQSFMRQSVVIKYFRVHCRKDRQGFYLVSGQQHSFIRVLVDVEVEVEVDVGAWKELYGWGWGEIIIDIWPLDDAHEGEAKAKAKVD